MNRINELFERKKNKVLSIYFTAGFPTLDSTLAVIEALDKSGADLIEIGIPFSDPIADGPTIQQSSLVALENKFTIDTLFEQLKNVRQITQLPLVLMGYYNPIFKYGAEKFFKNAHECGIDGFIIPDMPLSEYSALYKDIFATYHLAMNFLISPATTTERIKEIDNLSNGFIYLVTSFGVTGGSLKFSDEQIDSLKRISTLSLSSPVMGGFGIRNKNDFETVCEHVNGAIIGSEFIKILSQTTGNPSNQIQSFIQSIIK